MHLQTVAYEDSPSDDMVMDIFLKNDNFFLQNIPVRLVRFQKNISRSPFSNVHVKCFGLKFGELTSHQKIRLDAFIARSATREA